MTTIGCAELRENEIECDQDRYAVLGSLEGNSSLLEPGHLRERLIALDDLDAEWGDIDSKACGDLRSYERVQALRTRFEAANAELYEAMRLEIVGGGRPRALCQWLQGSEIQDESQISLRGLGFDWRDELLSGVLQLREPDEPDIQLLPEMVPYQPTPVRHMLDLLTATALSEEDVFVDLGSGMGHVPLLISMVTGARCLGIEVQAACVASARECAESLQLREVRFIAQNARAADFSSGTVFYLYSPFRGSMLTGVLSLLRRESLGRAIKVCSLGPCTRIIANERWLTPRAQPDAGRVTVFDSRRPD
jgi:hypothetical protein